MPNGYRVIKRHYRSQETGEVKDYYVVQREYLTFWRKRVAWEDCYEKYVFMDMTFTEIRSFDTIEKAVSFAQNSMRMVPTEEVVWPEGRTP